MARHPYRKPGRTPVGAKVSEATLNRRRGAQKKTLDRRMFAEGFYDNADRDARLRTPEFYWCVRLDDDRPAQYYWNETSVSSQEYKGGTRGERPC